MREVRTGVSCGGGGGGGGGGGFIPPTVLPPAGLHYERDAVVYPLGQPIHPNAPSNSGGRLLRYIVRPALPDGLQIDAATGIISGTPRVVAAPARYTVISSNFAGVVTTGLLIAVKVKVEPPANLSFENQNAIYTLGLPIPPNHPSVDGGDVISFTVQPALPLGLSIDAFAGAISGTPEAASAAADFTVTGSNAAGSVSVKVNIKVVLAGTALPTGAMSTARTNHTAILLTLGKVLVAGGYSDTITLASAALYEPGTGLWTATGSMSTTRYFHTATLLADGRVLVAGGEDLAGAFRDSAEL